MVQYQTRSRVTQTRARYRRGPSLMNVLKYWLRKSARGARSEASRWLISPLHMWATWGRVGQVCLGMSG